MHPHKPTLCRRHAHAPCCFRDVTPWATLTARTYQSDVEIICQLMPQTGRVLRPRNVQQPGRLRANAPARNVVPNPAVFHPRRESLPHWPTAEFGRANFPSQGLVSEFRPLRAPLWLIGIRARKSYAPEHAQGCAVVDARRKLSAQRHRVLPRFYEACEFGMRVAASRWGCKPPHASPAVYWS